MLDSLPPSDIPPRPEHDGTFALTGEDGAWRVLSGTLDVFGVPVDAQGDCGARRFLVEVGSGQMVFGVYDAPPAIQLIAVPRPGTMLDSASAAELGLLAAASPSNNMVAALEQWVARLLDASEPPLAPRNTQALPAGDFHTDTPNATICAATPLLWLEADGGAAALGRENATRLTPVTRSAWATLRQPGPIRLCTTAELAATQELAQAARAAMRLALDQVAVALSRRVAEEAAVLHARRSAEHRALDGSSQRLSALLSVAAAPATSGSAHDGLTLMESCVHVAAALGVRLRVPQPAVEAPGDDERFMTALSDSSGLFTRRVALADGWWRHDGGPMVARLKDGRPAALLWRGRRYVLRIGADPACPVTARLAAQVDGHSWVLYRPLPASTDSVRGLMRFALFRVRGDMTTALSAALAVALLGLLTPLAMGRIFESVIPRADRSELAQIVMLLASAMVGSLGLKAAQALAQLRLQGRMDAGMQAAIWERLLTLPSTFFRRYDVGELANRTLGINAAYAQLTGATMSVLLGGSFSVISFGLMLFYNWLLAVIGLVATALSLAVALVLAVAQRRCQRELNKLEGELSGRVLQFISGMGKLRSAGAERFVFAQWSDAHADQLALQRRARIFGVWQSASSQTVSVVTGMVIIWAVAFHLPGLAIGDYTGFNAAFGQFYSGLAGLAGAAMTVLSALPLFERTRPILEATPEVDPSKQAAPELSGRIDVSGASLRYPGNERPTLRDFDLAIRPGEFVALVGGSGAGKSSVLRLLLGFEQPNTGKVLFDGRDLSGLDLRSLRRQIGVVLQDGALQPGTIFDNIVGMGDQTLADAWEAARIAGIEADIKAMPMGMQTVISEASSTISGGQKQRLMIARAVVSKPRILFLDEATSALDNETQAQVARALDQLQATRVVIAHRLSTVVNADRIVVLENGRVVESGRFDELLRAGGPFSQLASRQLV